MVIGSMSDRPLRFWREVSFLCVKWDISAGPVKHRYPGPCGMTGRMRYAGVVESPARVSNLLLKTAIDESRSHSRFRSFAHGC